MQAITITKHNLLIENNDRNSNLDSSTLQLT